MTDVVKDPGSGREQTPTESTERLFEELVRDHQKMLLHMCYVALRDEELARDAVQETFLKAYRSLQRFRGESSMKTWLIRIALNTCRSMQRSPWLRHVDRRFTPDDLPPAAAAPPPGDTDVMCSVMQLPPHEREVVMLYYWQDMNVCDIAQTLGIAQSSVSRRLKHARNRLHDVLDRRDDHG